MLGGLLARAILLSVAAGGGGATPPAPPRASNLAERSGGCGGATAAHAITRGNNRTTAARSVVADVGRHNRTKTSRHSAFAARRALLPPGSGRPRLRHGWPPRYDRGGPPA